MFSHHCSDMAAVPGTGSVNLVWPPCKKTDILLITNMCCQKRFYRSWEGKVMFANSLYQITFLFLVLTAPDFIVEYIMQIIVHQGKTLTPQTNEKQSLLSYFQKLEDLHQAFRYHCP